MTNAEEKLREWQVLYREWAELEHRLHSPAAPDGGPAAAELKIRVRTLQQQCASALAALDSAVDAIRQRRARRENIS
jgi:ppGpp synthetase/RelA/SpoT-type nucleotidyltranferase